MSTFLLVITFLLPNGHRGVTVEKFETHAQCFSAMKIVSQAAPTATAYCQTVGEE
jgi:hypothetical protein